MKPVSQYISGRNLYYGFLHLAVIILAAEVIILAKQNRDLKGNKNAATMESIKEGDYFSLSGLKPVQSDAVLDSTSRKQMIFVFTTTCPFCKETLPKWKELSSNANRNSLSIIGISLDSSEVTLAYIKEQKIQFPVFVPTDRGGFEKGNKLSGVPKTVIRGEAGLVEKVWTGRLSEEELQKLARLTSHNPINLER